MTICCRMTSRSRHIADKAYRSSMHRRGDPVADLTTTAVPLMFASRRPTRTSQTFSKEVGKRHYTTGSVGYRRNIQTATGAAACPHVLRTTKTVVRPLQLLASGLATTLKRSASAGHQSTMDGRELVQEAVLADVTVALSHQSLRTAAVPARCLVLPSTPHRRTKRATRSGPSLQIA